MKRADLKAGERYASGGREWRRYGIDEVLLLSTEPVEDLESWNRRTFELPHPVTGDAVRVNGMLHPKGRHVAVEKSYGDGYTVGVLVTPGQIIGPWETIKAEYDALRAEERESRERQAAEHDGQRKRFRALQARMPDLPIGLTYLGDAPKVTLALDEFEALVASLDR